MTGVQIVDGVSAGLVETAPDFYYRRTNLSSDLPKAGSAIKEHKRTHSLDPPLRMKTLYEVVNM